MRAVELDAGEQERLAEALANAHDLDLVIAD
jgi:hypothetical protein